MYSYKYDDAPAFHSPRPRLSDLQKPKPGQRRNKRRHFKKHSENIHLSRRKYVPSTKSASRLPSNIVRRRQRAPYRQQALPMNVYDLVEKHAAQERASQASDRAWIAQQSSLTEGLLASFDARMTALNEHVMLARGVNHESTTAEINKLNTTSKLLQDVHGYALKQGETRFRQAKDHRDAQADLLLLQMQARDEKAQAERKQEADEEAALQASYLKANLDAELVASEQLRASVLERMLITLRAEELRREKEKAELEERLKMEAEAKAKQEAAAMALIENEKTRYKVLRDLRRNAQNQEKVRKLAKVGQLSMRIFSVANLMHISHSHVFRIALQLRFIATRLQRYTYYTPFVSREEDLPADLPPFVCPVTNAPLQIVTVLVQLVEEHTVRKMQRRAAMGWVETQEEIDSRIPVVASLDIQVKDVRNLQGGILRGVFALNSHATNVVDEDDLLSAEKRLQTEIALELCLAPQLGGGELQEMQKLLTQQMLLQKNLVRARPPERLLLQTHLDDEVEAKYVPPTLRQFVQKRQRRRGFAFNIPPAAAANGGGATTGSKEKSVKPKPPSRARTSRVLNLSQGRKSKQAQLMSARTVK